MKRWEWVVLLGLILLYAVPQLLILDTPFLRHVESPGTQFGKQVRPFLRFPVSEHKLWVLDISGPSLNPYSDRIQFFHGNHPPLQFWAAAGVCAVFGVSEATIRLLPLLCGVGSILLFFFLSRRFLPPPWSLVATAFFALTPMFAYFSVASIDQGPVLTLVLGVIATFLRWRETGRVRWMVACFLLQFMACYTEWSGYYAALFTASALFFFERRRWLALAPLAVNFVSFGITLLHLFFLDPSENRVMEHLFNVAQRRSTSDVKLSWLYPLGEAREVALYFTVPVVLLSAYWLFLLLRDRSRQTRTNFTLLLFAFLGSHEVFFPSYGVNHDYLTIALAPFFALTAADGLRTLISLLRTSLRRISLIVILLTIASQSAVVLHDRFTRIGAWQFYHRMGISLREATPPDSKCVILCHDELFYTPFYHDRCTISWFRDRNMMIRSYVANPREGYDEPALRRFLLENPEGYDFALVARADLIPTEIHQFFEGLKKGNAAFDRFWMEYPDSPLYRFLLERFGPPRILRGFAIFKIRP